MKVKYIILEDNSPILFGQTLTHKTVADAMGQKVNGAGFCSIDKSNITGDISVQVFGESISLNIKSKPEDSKLIKRLFADF